MKSTRILLILAVFFICVFTGFLVTRYVDTQSATTEVQPETDTLQQNIILFHVDRFGLEAPQLQSAWIIFLYYADRPSMGFLPIYQVGQGELPGGEFTFNADRRLPARYIQQLAADYKIPLSGYIILDDQALITFANLFPDIPDPNARAYPNAEHETIARICRYLKTMPGNIEVDVPWEDLMPDHFSTEIPMDIFVKNWKKLIRPAYAPNCEIIAAPQNP